MDNLKPFYCDTHKKIVWLEDEANTWLKDGYMSAVVEACPDCIQKWEDIVRYET